MKSLLSSVATSAFIVSLACASAAATPTAMQHIVYHLSGAEIVPGSFASKNKEMWRVGYQYMRSEEADDPQQHIYAVAIANEPNIWLWNRYEKVARHIVDSTAPYEVHTPIFAEEEALIPLELGHEVEYFKAHKAAALPDETIAGAAISVKRVHLGTSDITLYTNKASEKPVRISIRRPKAAYTVNYDSYENDVPFKAELFEAPKDIKMLEVTPKKTATPSSHQEIINPQN